MDWEPIVSNIATTQPALVVDGVRRVRFLNSPMEQLLGWNADELTARGWVATCVPQAQRVGVRQLVAHALSGARNEADLPLVTRQGRRLRVRAELSIERAGRLRALVVVARDIGEAPAVSVAACDCACEVSRAPGTAGRVTALRFLDPTRDATAWLGKPVGSLLEATGAAAAAPAAALVLEARVQDASRVVLPDSDETFRVVNVAAVSSETVRVTVRCVEAGLLAELVEAKIARAADANGLSDRERQVLQLLLRGRGVEEIATMLEIAPRTVKFHQANVLQKLGADSRLDLLRVVI
jgi:PAS domain S-box-containing protein